MTPSEFLNDRGHCIYNSDGSKCCCMNGSIYVSSADTADTSEDHLDPIIISAVDDMIDDEDYLIIVQS